MSETSQAEAEHLAKLARMAGQIADFFEAYSDEEAKAAIAAHINKFWPRRMRDDLLSHFGQDDARLHPLVLAALPGVRPGSAVRR